MGLRTACTAPFYIFFQLIPTESREWIPICTDQISNIGSRSGLKGIRRKDMGDQKRLLINPEGVVNPPRLKMNPHPESLENKTVFFRWNGKHNGNVFLERIAKLLAEKVTGVKVIKSWEVLPETGTSSRNNVKSQEFARKIAGFKPDLVIASQAD
jgi:hypothetical protein